MKRFSCKTGGLIRGLALIFTWSIMVDVYAQGSGNCLHFDGNNNSIRMSDGVGWNSVFAGAGKKFTIMCWVRFDNTSKLNHLIVKRGDSSCSPAVHERQIDFRSNSDGTVSFIYYGSLNADDMRWVSTTNTVPVNSWVHLAVTYDGAINSNDGLDRVQIFVNGIAQATALTSTSGVLGDIPSGPAPLAVASRFSSSGNRCDDGPSEFSGKMDELSVWSNLLTMSEIKDNMCQSLIGNEVGLVGYWNMNEGAGSVITDLTSNGNDGTLQ